MTGSIHAFALELLQSKVIHGNQWMEPTRRIHGFVTGISNQEIQLGEWNGVVGGEEVGERSFRR